VFVDGCNGRLDMMQYFFSERNIITSVSELCLLSMHSSQMKHVLFPFVHAMLYFFL